MPGIVYVLTNQAMPGLVKIGMTFDRPVEQRMKELDTTGIPLPFECFSAWEFEDPIAVEKTLHSAFGDHRIREKREFFRISPDKPTAILKQFGSRDVTPLGDVAGDDDPQDDIKALEKARSRRANFRFDMVNLQNGDQLESVFDDQVTCIVSGQKKVTFRGEEMSLSKAALIVARENGKQWKAVAGPDFWKYDDKTLTELRDEADGDE